jgi:hypothetical protein
MNIRLIGAMMIALSSNSTILSMEHQQTILKQEQEDSALIGSLPYRNGV